ncbi:hypothetical protein [uncultured Roseibium sp.]|uniref:hypothetical protein n=1 Tax=uncultured Roseibium sp. TaxID=1936171 RepID=UPI003217D375
MRHLLKSCVLTTLLLLTSGLAAQAQDSTSPGHFDLQLNRLSPSGQGCLMTFVVHNGFPGPLDKSAFEMVIFNGDGLVERMTVFDFGALPEGKTVVRQFEMPNMACEGVGRILVNGAKACTGEGITPDTCIGALKTDSKADVPFGS